MKKLDLTRYRADSIRAVMVTLQNEEVGYQVNVQIIINMEVCKTEGESSLSLGRPKEHTIKI